MKETTTDLLPDKEILGSKLNPRVATKMSAGAEAGQVASAISKGGRFRCARVGAEVSPQMCVKRFKDAKESGNVWSPCLECAKVLTMMKDLPTPPAKQSPKPAPKPTPEVVTMPKPVKKEVPATEARLEIVPPKPAKAPSVDAFTAGFEVYSAKMSRKALRVSYAKLSPRAIHFSASAVNEFDLKGYQTVDAYYKPGVLRFVFRSDNLGEFTPTKRMADRTELKICATGFVKLWKIPEAAFGKKLSIVEHGPGLLEVSLDLGSQKRAALVGEG
jgi:hypothetical protein